MFGHQPFYHSTIRKYITLFGTLFNDIVIERKIDNLAGNSWSWNANTTILTANESEFENQLEEGDVLEFEISGMKQRANVGIIANNTSLTLDSINDGDDEITTKPKKINADQTLKIPITYGPREKMMERINRDPDLDTKVAITLPRMSFEMTGLNYDSGRKLTRTHKNRKFLSNSRILEQYTPQPYIFNFSLHIFVRNYSDGVNIVENIIPFFCPEWTSQVNLIPEMDITLDIPTILQGINLEDSYEGNFDTRRSIIWSLDFTMKGYLFGPTTQSNTIKRTTTHLYDTTEYIGSQIKSIKNATNQNYAANTSLEEIDASNILTSTGNTGISATIATFPTADDKNIIEINPDEDEFKLEQDIHEYLG